MNIVIPYKYADFLYLLIFKTLVFKKFQKPGLTISSSAIKVNSLPLSYEEFMNTFNAYEKSFKLDNITFATIDVLDRPFTTLLQDLAHLINGNISALEVYFTLNSKIRLFSAENKNGIPIFIFDKKGIIPNQFAELVYDKTEIAMYISNLRLEQEAINYDALYNASLMQQQNFSNSNAFMQPNNNIFNNQNAFNSFSNQGFNNNMQQPNQIMNKPLQNNFNNNTPMQSNQNNNIILTNEQLELIINKISSKIIEHIDNKIQSLLNTNNNANNNTINNQGFVKTEDIVNNVLNDANLTAEDLKDLNI